MLDFAPELWPGPASFDQREHQRSSPGNDESQSRHAQQRRQDRFAVHRIDDASDFTNEFHPVVFLVVRRDDRAEVLVTPSPTPRFDCAVIVADNSGAVLWQVAAFVVYERHRARGTDLAMVATTTPLAIVPVERATRFDYASEFTNEFHPVIFLIFGRDDRAEVLLTPSPTPRFDCAPIVADNLGALLWRVGVLILCVRNAPQDFEIKSFNSSLNRTVQEITPQAPLAIKPFGRIVHCADASNFSNEFHPVVFLHVGRDDRAEVLPTPSPTPSRSPATPCAPSGARHA